LCGSQELRIAVDVPRRMDDNLYAFVAGWPEIFELQVGLLASHSNFPMELASPEVFFKSSQKT